ncbi:hypothetical protein ACQKP0_00865 [Heyndrickxia sp. NPDC080065]|uniref:hypothetical protein n=1 Tax=Heyndrickxia sp. NPDC080065 TaxID=3390568 RepID=UPI003D002593
MEKKRIEFNPKEDYSNVRISLNQIKGLLNTYIRPVKGLKIKTNDGDRFEVNNETLINHLLVNLNRNQLLELLHMLQIISNRKSNIQHYLEYILQGISIGDTRKF